jgi:uncharacterized delta-60 repeat protein
MLARSSRKRSLTLIGAIAIVIAVANPAAAPPGDLDTTFDGDGKVTTDFAGDFDEAWGLAIQGDGKIVAAGYSGNDFGLARYSSNGSLDPTFDGDGKTTTDFAGQFDQARAVAIHGDGRITAAGFAWDVSGASVHFALARYNPDGSLDTTFDTDGKVVTDVAAGEDEQGFAMAIQGNGKIVVAGRTSSDFALARYNADGSLDTTFDGDGKVTTDFAGAPDEAWGLAIQGDGKIVAAGYTGGFGTYDFALARYNADGSLDATFDGDGKVTTDFAGNDNLALGMALQGDGKIVAAGVAISADFDTALARYNVDGSLDPTFDGDGRVTTDFAGSDDEAFGVAIQGDGRIVAVGLALFNATYEFALARYRTDGSLDPTFSGDGKVLTPFGNDDQALAVAIQGDRKIVAAGRTTVFGSFSDFALARYEMCRRTSRPTSAPACP